MNISGEINKLKTIRNKETKMDCYHLFEKTPSTVSGPNGIRGHRAQPRVTEELSSESAIVMTRRHKMAARIVSVNPVRAGRVRNRSVQVGRGVPVNDAVVSEQTFSTPRI